MYIKSSALYRNQNTFSPVFSKNFHLKTTIKMNKSILLVILPCVIAMAVAQMYVNTADPAYKYYYNNQLNAYRQQTGLYRAGSAATAQLKSARLLNYLFGFLLLLDLTNVTGNSLTSLG